MNNEQEYIYEIGDDEEKEEVNLAGYQVTKAELFAHSREPSVTIWQNKIKFNMACLKRFPKVTHVLILINQDQKRLIVKPCSPDTPDSLRWATGGGEKEVKARDMLCYIFSEKIYHLMEWSKDYRYKILGKPAVCNDEALYLFKLTDFELFIAKGKYKRRSYLPEDWRDCFGTPIEEHEDVYNIDLADGYIITGKKD